MIFDPKVEVTCDGDGCDESIFVELHAGARSMYFGSDSDIERGIRAETWIVRDGEHFCSEECIAAIPPPKRNPRKRRSRG